MYEVKIIIMVTFCCSSTETELRPLISCKLSFLAFLTHMNIDGGTRIAINGQLSGRRANVTFSCLTTILKFSLLHVSAKNNGQKFTQFYCLFPNCLKNNFESVKEL